MIFQGSEKRRLEPFLPVREVAERVGLFRMPLLNRVWRSWQLIWLEPDALARRLRVKFEIGYGALEIPCGSRVKDMVGMHGIVVVNNEGR